MRVRGQVVIQFEFAFPRMKMFKRQHVVPVASAELRQPNEIQFFKIYYYIYDNDKFIILIITKI